MYNIDKILEILLALSLSGTIVYIVVQLYKSTRKVKSGNLKDLDVDIIIKMTTHLILLGNYVIEPKDISNGICHELVLKYRNYREELAYVLVLLRSHPDAGSSGLFPITVGDISGTAAYALCDDKWCSDTEYGIKRRQWCNWLAAKTLTKLKEDGYGSFN